MITLSKKIRGEDPGLYVSLENVHLESGLTYDVTIEISEQPSLRKCPFCGRNSHLAIHESDSHIGNYYVVCRWCRARGPEDHSKIKAIKAWNEEAENEN